MQLAISTDFDRHIRLDGCCNFRDAGGYRTRDGSRVRTGRLYRADGPRALSGADRAVIRTLGLATVIDLRTAAEREAPGDFTDGASATFVHRLAMTDVLPTDEELQAWGEPATVARHYEELLTAGADAICEALAILTDPAAYPVLVHCSAGKDRTGVLVAVIQSLLGVPEEEVVADYGRSGPAMVELVASLARRYPEGRDRILAMAPAITAVHPETMRLLLASVREAYGSIDGYVEALGMQSAIAYLRSCLLEP